MTTLRQNRTPKRQTSPAPQVRLKTKSSPRRRSSLIVDEAVRESNLAEPSSELAGPAVVTTVLVKLDVGFGNALFIRGEGDGLSWDKGSRMVCLEPSVWIWSAEGTRQNVVFKLLVNDQLWSQGDNFSVAPGGSIEVAPAF